MGHLQLFVLRHAATRRLFAVTEGRIEKMDAVWGHRHHLQARLSMNKCAKTPPMIQIYNFYRNDKSK
jgi:hypothetical protein